MLVTITENNLDQVLQHYSYAVRLGSIYSCGVPKDILPYDLSELKTHLFAKIKSSTNDRPPYIAFYLYLSYFIDEEDFSFLEDVVYQYAPLKSIGDICIAMPLNDLKRFDKMVDKQLFLQAHLLNELDEANITINSEIKEMLYNQKQHHAAIKSMTEAREKTLKK